ncbi:MAG: hypothetical protein HYY16_10815 [Planctomycetes bacterium]|nr:hypothetical protein [Planctomycetota bacterium]
MTYILPLRHASDRALAGAKAAGCAALMRIGVPVPRGFVLTTKAFEVFLLYNSFDAVRRHLLDQFLSKSNEEELLGECLKAQFGARWGDFPPEVKKELLPSYADLADPVVVRSSTTIENGRAGAVAGVYRTELQIRAARIMQAVLECWSHAFSYTAISHALRHDVNPMKISLALLVQEMVSAQRSGVLFTQDPSRPDSDAAVVDITTDPRGRATLRLDRRTPDRLLKIGLRIERALGGPQEIEWAERDGIFWFLQTRPIACRELREELPAVSEAAT